MDGREEPRLPWKTPRLLIVLVIRLVGCWSEQRLSLQRQQPLHRAIDPLGDGVFAYIGPGKQAAVGEVAVGRLAVD